MRFARLLCAAALFMPAGCMLPRPPESSSEYTDSCPPAASTAHAGWLIISYRLPDCRTGFRWTYFRSDKPIFAVESGTQTSILTEEAWRKALKAEVSRHLGQPPIVYVHGYKTDHEDALRRSRAIAELPKEKRAVVTISWPSYAGLAKYFWDQTNNQFVRTDAASQIRQIGKAHPGTVIIAHSMGNHMLLEAADASSGLKHLILASPDVDRANLAHRLSRPGGLGVPATLYASRADQALSAAWRSHGLPRGGDLSSWVTGRQMKYIYLDAKSTDVVDTSEARAGPTGHAAFIENEAAAADLCRVLDEVPVNAGRKNLGGHHWLLLSEPHPDECLDRARRAVRIALKKAP